MAVCSICGAKLRRPGRAGGRPAVTCKKARCKLARKTARQRDRRAAAAALEATRQGVLFGVGRPEGIGRA